MTGAQTSGIEHSESTFSFIPKARSGRVLFVGEGNMSFSLSLAKRRRISPSRMVATTFEGPRQLSGETKENAAELSRLGASVIHGVDGRRLKDSIGPTPFDLIIFQFPNVGSRDPLHGRNPNAVLLRRFLESAKAQLRASGEIAVTLVDTSYYQGVFDVEGAANFAGVQLDSIHPFKASAFAGYTHTKTLMDKSGISRYRTFKTYVFRKSRN